MVMNALGLGSKTKKADEPATSVAESVEPEWQGEDLQIREVRNDSTGKWRVAVLSSPDPQDQYAYEYYQRYMKGEDFDNLFIINFTLGTTTQINASADPIVVTVHEYVDGEEHDADLLNSGMDLEQTQYLSKESGEVLDI